MLTYVASTILTLDLKLTIVIIIITSKGGQVYLFKRGFSKPSTILDH